MSDERPPGLVYTFYSYKGGVGRSMALASVGAVMAIEGRRVLAVDWDLEAPGLEAYFQNAATLVGDPSKVPGIVDLLSAHAQGQSVSWRDCLLRAEFFGQSLDVISAGRRSDDYRRRVQELDWETLFREHRIGNYVNELREEWRNSYDFVLIDSRTGITDIGDICTVILPDVLVILFITNHQSVDGVRAVIERALSARSKLPLNRNKLLVVPVPARDERDREYDKSLEWQQIFVDVFGTAFRDWLPKEVEPIDALNRIFIPYIPTWSFGERIPVIESERERADPTSIGAAYTRLASLLTNHLDWYAAENRVSESDIVGTRVELKAARNATIKAQTLLGKQKRLWRLALQLGIPIIVILAVLSSILWNRFVPMSQKPTPPPPNSVAVLPFKSLSNEKSDAYFADGMQDEILRGLVKIADLKVVGRASVAKYNDVSSLDLSQTAHALGVRYILDGSVQRVGDRIRVQIQLFDTETGAQVWAERYDRQLSDIFAIQSEIAEKIVSQLQARLTPEEKAAIEVLPTQDISAYSSYVKAVDIVNRAVDSSLIGDLWEAEQLLDQATTRDPKFFLGFCKLAYVHDLLYFNSLDHTDARLTLAKAALESAKKLQPDAGEFHLAAAYHYYFGYLDYDKAREELTIARAKLPNDPYPILLLGYIDRRQGHWDSSNNQLEHALSLDPRNLLVLRQVALNYTMLRRYKDAIDMFDRAVAVAPDDPTFLVGRAVLELDWRANTKPLHNAVDEILARDPNEAGTIADSWLYLAFCEKDMAAADKALKAMTENGCQQEGFPYPRSWCEGLVAKEKNDTAAARLAFSQARDQVDRLVHEQPSFASAVSVLGMIDASLGNKDDAITEGRKAVDLLPIGKDAITGSTLLQNLAVIYAWSGERQQAFAILRQLVGMHGYLSYGQLSLDPFWTGLRNDPGFPKILESLQPKSN